MKKLLFGLGFLTLLASALGVYNFFNKYHRTRNAQAPRPELVIYTHSSFMNPYGPGPEIAQEFEKLCHCDVKYVDAGGGQVLLQKLIMSNNVDVVLGLDQVILKEAAQKIKWRDLKAHDRPWKKVFLENKYKTFLAYDWAPVTFVYRDGQKIENAESLRGLLESLPDKSLSLQDPKQSSLGLQLVYWAFVESGEDLGKLSELARLVAKKTKKLSPDWSGAYGLFKRGMSPFVLSYMTSPLYHLKAENDQSFGTTKIGNGHPMQIEYVAVPDTCRSCGLAKRFVEFLHEDFSQRLLYEKNYMLPVVEGIVPADEKNNIPEVEAISSRPLDSFVDRKEEILDKWNQVAK